MEKGAKGRRLAAAAALAAAVWAQGPNPASAAGTEKESYPPAVRALTERGLEIVAEFKAPGGLTGYAARQGSREMILYATPDGQHVLVGTLVDARARNLTRRHLAEHMPERDYSGAWDKLAKADWVAVGAEDPERIVYTFVDPNCSYCNRLWRATRPHLDDGLQVRYLLVGVLRSSSTAKAAAVLQADDPGQAYRRHERRFSKGGIEPADSPRPEVREKVRANGALMQELGVSGTPAIFYRGADGKVRAAHGMPGQEKLGAIYGAR